MSRARDTADQINRVNSSAADATAITVDSSENVLIGRTDSGSQTEGTTIYNGGTIEVTNASDLALRLNRKTNDGTIIELRKDAGVIASIGVLNSNNLTISGTVADHGGLQFGTHCVIPMEANVDSDGTVDLGSSNSKFKDAYLSGGIYLGGTGSANKLEDYEEGTWTPSCTVGAVSSGTGNYTKVGRLVTITAYMGGFTNTTNNEVLIISNLPFTGGVTSVAAGSAMWAFLDKDFGYQTVYYDGSSQIRFYHSTNGNFDSLRHIDLDGSSSEVYFTATYMTT